MLMPVSVCFCLVSQDLYMKGVDTYTEKKYAATIKHIEGALVEYYKEFSRCSALCEGTYDHESFPDFYNAVAGMYVCVCVCMMFLL